MISIREMGYLLSYSKIKRILLLMVIGILVFSYFNVNVENILAAPSNSYYVANSGDNSNDGLSPSSPWRTIGKVVSALGDGTISQGDDIYFNRGDTFNDAQLDLDESIGGTSSDWMTFGAYGTGAKPILSYNSASASIIFIDATISYIIIEDIHFTTNQFHAILSTLHPSRYFSHLTIRRCDFDNLNGAFGIYLRCGEYYKIEDCTFDMDSVDDHAIAIGGSTNHQIRDGIIRNCNIRDSKDGINIHFHDVYGESVGPNHLIENCNIRGWASNENGIDISGGDNCKNILVKNCEFHHGYNPPIAFDHGSTDIVLDNIYIHDIPGSNNALMSSISDNLIVRNSIIKHTATSDRHCFSTQYASGKDTTNTFLYNNDFITDDTQIIRIMDSSDVGWGFKNNIFYSTKSSSPNIFVYLERGATYSNIDGVWANNMWWRGDGLSGSHWQDVSGTYNWAQWTAKSQTSGELRDDPEFVDATGGDFTLRDTSPCIDAGEWLTTTNGGGTGTTITVHEANYFFAGLPTLNVAGDNIFIGDDTGLVITSVNYNAETITVDRSITWSNGDSVSLSSYSGSKVDIGAYESVSSGPDTTPPVISNVILTESDPLDTDPLFGWIKIEATVTDNSGVETVMIDFSCSNGSSFNVSMNKIGSTYYYTTSTMFSNLGDYSYYIWANDINGNPSMSNVYGFSMPPNWDINNDGQCNILDLTLINNRYMDTGQNGWIREDVDNNGIVEVLDFVWVTEHYGDTW